MTLKDIEAFWEFLGGKEAEMQDENSEIYLWSTLGRIYKKDLIKWFTDHG